MKRGPFKNLNHRRANDHWAHGRKALGITDKDCVPYATRHSLATRIIEETGDLTLILSLAAVLSFFLLPNVWIAAVLATAAVVSFLVGRLREPSSTKR